ncbi:Anti-sigma regulatory factor (Ser/Thr protein kinase) [Pedococcus cremeus]|uniref:Anti-sigma regulatory factor (Ser/Thr protein kinase) n=1 Tax=Pedococcus cremeus TaxID=587636 RepID=A0A1H9WPG1_9MICO|nr:ATP-binding protein [Pedococcus cremeus]SES35806.1 Anti-sigma regulatory factor (Ser/Thr protein kinase) [Pedococcus cremeus]
MCEVSDPAETRLPNDKTAPGSARAFLREAACEVHHAEVLGEAELLVSELVTNAVLHGAPPITLRVECDGTRLRVSVTDRNSDPAYVRDAGPEDESGRGIRLVDFISDEWGVEPRLGEGKDVWFTIRNGEAAPTP